MAQGILNTHSEYPLNSGVAFNSQRLHEAYKAKGVLELHVLQKEAAQLKTQYQSNVTPDEMTVRQIQHSQFHVNPNMKNNIDLLPLYHALKQQQPEYLPTDITSYLNYYMKNEPKESPSGIQKPPLQQQLMQHRFLQQKRQIFQKQAAYEASHRRQMLRQQSYKIAQQQQIVPPLPLNESDAEALLAFQAIMEGNSNESVASTATPSPGSSISGSPKMLKTSYIQGQQQQSQQQQQSNLQSASSLSLNKSPNSATSSNDSWNTLSGSMQTCQISDQPLSLDSWSTNHPQLFQVYSSKH